MAKKRGDHFVRDDPAGMDPAADAEAARLLEEAAAMLPPETDLTRFRGLLDAGALAAAWEELRSRAELRPTPFGLWLPMSKAADLLGGD